MTSSLEARVGRVLTVLVLSQLGLGAHAKADPTPVTAPVDVVYAPPGYDADDDATLVLAGQLPDGCWTLGTATAAVDEATMTVVVTAPATHEADVPCFKAIVPFEQTVQLGRLKAGVYDVVVEGRPEAATTPLVVEEARPSEETTGPLAPVERVTLRRGDDGFAEIELRGRYPYMLVGCLVLRDVEVVLAPGSVLDVTPHAELTEGDECVPQEDSKAFLAKAQVATALPAGRYLVNVRQATGPARQVVQQLEP